MERNQILKIYGTDYLQMTKEILEESQLAARVEEKQKSWGKVRKRFRLA